mgnify:CR=1 FL=1|jgi:hypothetical protein
MMNKITMVVLGFVSVIIFILYYMEVISLIMG